MLDNNIPIATLGSVTTKFKIIDIKMEDLAEVKIAVAAQNNFLDESSVTAVYQVKCSKDYYFNAELKCTLTQAKRIEEDPYIIVRDVRCKVFEAINPIMCSNCWSYGHTRPRCSALRICKKCSSAACVDDNHCKPKCHHYVLAGKRNDHQVTSHLCEIHNLKVIEYKRTVFHFQYQNPPTTP